MEGGGYGAPSRVLGLEVVDMIVDAERRERCFTGRYPHLILIIAFSFI